MRIDSAVTTTLLVRLTQNSRSGRVSTAVMLCSVGGIGSDAGEFAIFGPGLTTLTHTTYSGTKKTAAMTVATSGRTDRLTATPPVSAGCAGRRRRRRRRSAA